MSPRGSSERERGRQIGGRRCVASIRRGELVMEQEMSLRLRENVCVVKEVEVCELSNRDADT